VEGAGRIEGARPRDAHTRDDACRSAIVATPETY
jgi:hypothetical protein